MCLSIAIKRPNDVLAQGVHAGHEWMVIQNDMGFRCGYVKVNPGHPWHGKSYNDFDADVHGGLTFAEHDTPCDKGGDDNGYWIGFDCAHYNDAPDPSLRSDGYIPGIFRNGIVRDQEYVESECRSLCEQAAKADEPDYKVIASIPAKGGPRSE